MDKLIKIVQNAGKIALESQNELTVSEKKDTSIVTNGDIAVSKYLEYQLKILYPEYDVFSEENCENLPKSEKVIVIDPIDGTESYSRKEDSWAILIGFLNKGIPERGIVYQPVLNRLYYAEKGSGAYLNENGVISQLDCSNRIGLLSGVFSPKISKEETQLANDQKIEKFNYMYSASLKIMSIAKGENDLYTNFRKKCSMWDLIAPLVVLKESGGKLLFDEEIKFDFHKILMDKNFVAINNRIVLDDKWKEI